VQRVARQRTLKGSLFAAYVAFLLGLTAALASATLFLVVWLISLMAPDWND
jgi:hypothetical protein